MTTRVRLPRAFAAACGLLLASYTGAAQSLEVPSGAPVQFAATADSLASATQVRDIGVGARGGGNVAFTFAGFSTFGTNDPNFMVVSPSSGVTPAVVFLGLNPNVVPYLHSGSYRLTLLFAKPGESCPPCAGVDVALRLIPQPPPRIGAVVSAATLQPAAISPGQVVSIFGEHLGTPPVSSQFDAGGQYPTTLGNTTVTFNGMTAGLLYVSTNQINAAVPYGVTGQTSTDVVVTHNGAPSPAFSVPATDTAPAIFTATQNGSGQGAIQNNGISFNNENNPAPKGSVIVMFGTGVGLWSQALPDGSMLFAASSRIIPAASVSLTIGGQPAKIQYAGPAPYQVSGVIQVNAVVPDGISSGPQPVVLTIGQNSNAQQQVTVAVQ